MHKNANLCFSFVFHGRGGGSILQWLKDLGNQLVGLWPACVDKEEAVALQEAMVALLNLSHLSLEPHLV